MYRWPAISPANGLVGFPDGKNGGAKQFNRKNCSSLSFLFPVIPGEGEAGLLNVVLDTRYASGVYLIFTAQYHYPFERPFSGTPGLHVGIVLQGKMDDPALVCTKWPCGLRLAGKMHFFRQSESHFL